MARSFATDTDIIALPLGATLLGSTQAALVCWFKVASSSLWRHIYTEVDNFDEEIYFRLEGGANAGKFGYFWRTPTGIAQGISTATYDDGNWHWLAVLRTATNAFAFHIDGTSILTDATTVGTTANTGTVSIGQHTITGNESFIGSLAWMVTYAGSGSIATINEARNVAYGRITRKPTLWMPLGLASPETDWSGNGFSGTVTGAAVAGNPPMPPWFGFAQRTPYLVASGAPPPLMTASRFVQSILTR